MMPPRHEAAAAVSAASFGWHRLGAANGGVVSSMALFSQPSGLDDSMNKSVDGQGRRVSEEEYQAILARALARGESAEVVAAEQPEDPKRGEVFDLSLKRFSFKLEQNLGCELPVCVASRRETKRQYIEVVTDEGVIWRLTRQAGGCLPAPEHYPYWLWFLDRCQGAAEYGLIEPPQIVLNPPEIFDLFGAPKRSKRSGFHGSRYDSLDAAFKRFSALLINKRGAFFDGNRTYSGEANLGTLCYYVSWRADPDEKQQVLEFAKGAIIPGKLLWDSIRAGYLKSVPLEPLKHLTYVEQRLLTYLAKHCRPGGQFTIAPDKLLPKIPLHCPTDKIRHRLGPHHEALARAGFLHDARIEGRGNRKLIVYERCKDTFPPPRLRLAKPNPLLK